MNNGNIPLRSAAFATMIKRFQTVLAGALLVAVPVFAQDAPTPPTPPETPSSQGRAWSRSFRIGGGYLGVMLNDVDESNRAELAAPDDAGAVITSVTKGSPADEAGLKAKDVVLSFDGKPVENASALAELVRETPSGRRVTLEVLRNGSRTNVDVKLGKRKMVFAESFTLPRELGNIDSITGHIRIMANSLDSIGRVLGDSLSRFNFQNFEALGSGGDVHIFMRRGRLGLELQSLTGQLAKYFGVESRKGVLVSTVTDSGGAQRAGLQAGDVIIAVDGKDVASPADVTRAINAKDSGTVSMRIVRDRREQTVELSVPGPRPDTFRFELNHGNLFNRAWPELKELEIDLHDLQDNLEELHEELEDINVDIDVNVDGDRGRIEVETSTSDDN